MLSILIRTALVISTLIVGLSIPFFGLILALIGSLLTMFVVSYLSNLFSTCKTSLKYLKSTKTIRFYCRL
ncbi:hypothetical protein GIB67_002923 [Kingdonia uniflora]|uniref:Amino acid transporter transmembrane domain-containing protein n=1 Tax=Kingdonia uniflora TaxID=39325 RepID=A0A7J7N3C7_9MAGN|nr:hypothetical protein GIB67_002923 [Kingdonia uniflora]